VYETMLGQTATGVWLQAVTKPRQMTTSAEEM
jgi:hypothetical protein